MEIVDILDLPRPVLGAPGLIYSTNPQIAITHTGGKCVLKDNNIEIVFAEAVCYSLAKEIGLEVPEFLLARDRSDHGNLWFGSTVKGVRSGVDVLIKSGMISNLEIIPRTIVFDIWVCNIDRNIGNFVGELFSETPPSFKLFAIDFEKSEVCRGKGSLELSSIPAQKNWPTEELGRWCRERRFPIPKDFCGKIATMGSETINSIVSDIAHDIGMPENDNYKNCLYNLTDRKQKIDRLVREGWAE